LSFFVFKDVLLLARIVLAEISSLGSTISRGFGGVFVLSLFSQEMVDERKKGGACGLLINSSYQ
jgi:hypothetical protein